MIRIDPTPNPNALKVTVDRALAPDRPMTFANASAASGHPLAHELLSLPGVASVFIFKNYVTITKSADGEWSVIEPMIDGIFRKAMNE